jgi:iron-sulfur cluster repair protein YtfE (RIC family)
MSHVTQPLHDEHATLFPHVEAFRTTADRVSDGSPAALATALDDAVRFLTGTLIPHAAAEEQVLYPQVEQILGADTTRTMRRDHAEIHRYIEELEALHAALGATGPTSEQANELRLLLYGLYAILRLHFAKEEEVYLPLLDQHLSADTARSLFERMEQAAGAAHGPAGHHA